jgi:hypothetical protein
MDETTHNNVLSAKKGKIIERTDPQSFPGKPWNKIVCSRGALPRAFARSGTKRQVDRFLATRDQEFTMLKPICKRVFPEECTHSIFPNQKSQAIGKNLIFLCRL